VIDPQPESSRSDPPPVHFTVRIVALLEVLLCSGYPTQIAIGGTFAALGIHPFNPTGGLTISYVVGVSITDTLLVLGLVVLFLRVHGERPRDVIAGRGPLVVEVIAGVPLIFAALAIALAVLVAVQKFAPSLHTVENNPLQDVLRSPWGAWLFSLVVIVAGGLREEVQRAFVLHRFDAWLGGGSVGVIVSSIAFGAGHLLQGTDAAIATGLLGAFWGVVYLRRRSAIAPIISHSGFDLLEIAQFLVGRG
jgi:membrane protease YdiL (CAAX protease family)